MIAIALFLVVGKGQVAPEWLVRPGISLGSVRIGASQSGVVEKLGKASEGDAAMGHFWTTWIGGKGGRLDVYATRKPGDNDPITVDIVRATSPSFKTASGLATGAKDVAFKTAFPKAVPVDSYKSAVGKVQIWDDKVRGFGWEVGPNGKVVALIVHRVDTSLKGQYMPLGAYLEMPVGN